MLRSFIDKIHFPESHKKVLVAVSGGLDSIVLLDILLKHKYTVGVAHVNFQLRGEESDADEDFVRRLAFKYGSALFATTFNTNNYAIERGLSIQTAARELRYRWFKETLEQHGYDVLVTAHHLNDSIETSVHNFIRGTGADGLTGIPEIKDHVLRPLLACSQIELKNYAIENELAWREDASNAKDDYTRNFIRHHIIPKMKEINPSLDETWTRNRCRLLASRELSLLGLNVLKERFVVLQRDVLRIEKKLFDSVDHPAGILYEIIKLYGFNFAQCDDIISASSGQAGKIFLAGHNRLTIDRGHLAVDTIPEGSVSQPIGMGQTLATLVGKTIRITQTDQPLVTLNPNMAVLDIAKLVFPLVWRTWKPGDFFYPSGMQHRKKISNFLTDIKIPSNEKACVTVVESGGAIAWVAGHRVDERFRVTQQTTAVFILELQ